MGYYELIAKEREKEDRSSERIEGAVGALFQSAYLGTLELTDLSSQGIDLITEGVVFVDEEGWVSSNGYLVLKVVNRFLDDLHDAFTRDVYRGSRDLKSIAKALLQISDD